MAGATAGVFNVPVFWSLFCLIDVIGVLQAAIQESIFCSVRLDPFYNKMVCESISIFVSDSYFPREEPVQGEVLITCSIGTEKRRVRSSRWLSIYVVVLFVTSAYLNDGCGCACR